ncbi:MAG: O-antigen ligase family protein [Planctomycetia bacterium]
MAPPPLPTRTPPAPALPVAAWPEPAARGALLLAAAAGLLLADVPGAFTRGDVLRGVLLPLVAALAGWAVAAQPGRLARLAPAAWLLVLAPLAARLLALPAVDRAALATPAALARGLSPALALALLSLALAGPLAQRVRADRAWQGLLLGGALAGLWTALDWLQSGVGAGPFGRPGVSGPVLGALLGPALVLALPGGVLLRTALLVPLALGCAASGSRTGWAAGALSLLLALALSPAAHVRRSVARGAALLALLGGVGAALLLTGLLPLGGPTLEVRRGLWRASATLVAEAPLGGPGLGSFRSEVLRGRDAQEARLSRGREPFMAHNDVLQASAEGGLPAGLLLLAFGAGLLALGLRAARASGRDPRAAAALALLGAQAAASLAEQVLPDPAHVLLAGVALATLLGLLDRRAGGACAPGTPARALVLLLVAAAGACSALLARDLLAELHLARYRAATPAPLAPPALAAASAEHLERGALAWRPDHPEALYRLGVSRAELGRLEAAREAWRAALAVEPGLSEARMDMAHAWVLEERAQEAAEVLREARRHDPTRYDLALRQGHVALGPEPVPGAPAPALEPLEPLRRYNEAQALDPSRFETEVAYARVARRLGDLDSAGEHLRRAEGLGGRTGELLVESFRLAEAEGRADERTLAAILTLALATDEGQAPALRRSLAACEAAAEAREAVVRAAAQVGDARRAGVARAWSAFTVRLLALLQAGLDDAGAVREEARAALRAGRHGGALARLRAVLAAPPGEAPAQGAERAGWLGLRGDLLLEAAGAASRVDGALARGYFAEGHLLKGLEFLERGLLPEAQRLLAKAAEDDPAAPDALAWLALARLRAGDAAGGEAALLQSLERDPSGAALEAIEALAPLLARPAVRDARQAGK